MKISWEKIKYQFTDGVLLPVTMITLIAGIGIAAMSVLKIWFVYAALMGFKP